MLALARPDLVNRLLVADIAPVAYTHSQSHLIAAMSRLDPASFTSRSDADAALAETVTDPGVRAFLGFSRLTFGQLRRVAVGSCRAGSRNGQDHRVARMQWRGEFDRPTLF